MNLRLSRREALVAGLSAVPLVALPGLAKASPLHAERKMHLGLVTYNVAKDWDLDTIIKNLTAAKIEGVEFRTTHSHGVEPSLDADGRKRVRDKCGAAGFKQISLGSICEFQSADPANVKQNIDTCQEFIRLAKDIGARAVKVRPNGAPKNIPLDKTLEQIGKSLAEVGKIGADNGVEIWMEVHGGITQLALNSRKIMDFCGHPNVGVTWNSNNTDVVDGSVKSSFELLDKFIRCCHITELWSDYPYHEFFQMLNGIGYDRFTLCEVGSSIKSEDGAAFLNCYRGLWNELSKA
ncbi:MAG: TIM barrel protein [Chthonomonadales bacterium]